MSVFESLGRNVDFTDFACFYKGFGQLLTRWVAGILILACFPNDFRTFLVSCRETLHALIKCSKKSQKKTGRKSSKKLAAGFGGNPMKIHENRSRKSSKKLAARIGVDFHGFRGVGQFFLWLLTVHIIATWASCGPRAGPPRASKAVSDLVFVSAPNLIKMK